jgi:hypothetical protein
MYLEFWKDFSANNPQFDTDKKKSSDNIFNLPSISQRRSSVQVNESHREEAAFSKPSVSQANAEQSKETATQKKDEAAIAKL